MVHIPTKVIIFKLYGWGRGVFTNLFKRANTSNNNANYGEKMLKSVIAVCDIATQYRKDVVIRIN